MKSSIKKIFIAIKKKLITLHFSLLFIFVSLFLSAMLVLIVVNYIHATYAILFTANRLMNEVSTKLYTVFNREIMEIQQDSYFAASLIRDNVLNANDFSEVSKYTTNLINKSYMVQSAYWADTQGNMVQAQYNPDDSITTEVFDRLRSLYKFTLHDSHGNLVKQHFTTRFSFDPRLRPWYFAAKQAKKIIWTDLYLFKEKNHFGVTSATPVYSYDNTLKGVFGLDIRLDWLSWYINQNKITPSALIFIVTQNGKMIALPDSIKQGGFTELSDIHSLADHKLAAAFDKYNKIKKSHFNFDFQGSVYMAKFQKLQPFANQGWIIGIVLPQSDFTQKLKINELSNIIISIFILSITILIVSRLVGLIVKPILSLTKQTEKIKNFELDNNVQLKTKIKEVNLLSDAIHSMRHGLRSFQKYVPASLVRQLIDKGEDAVVGGSKINITIFFSDIENFTALAERLDPNSLMEQTCEYFDELSKILVAENATIDKYIGDSIMALWGAPTFVSAPCYKAARAALKCQARLEELNQKWLESGKPALNTRIGIHTGEAIVGNVGSSERLNYTAIGDAVNIASRIENINKYYHTRILVSEDVYALIKNDFFLRYVDCIALRGKRVACHIYELIDENVS